MVKVSLLFIVSLINQQLKQHDKHHWTYDGEDGPAYWPLHYDTCGGQRQSPIDIEESKLEYDSGLREIRYQSFDSYSRLTGNTILNVTNNGHAASCAIKGDYYVTGGGLDGTYKSVEFHFHWGGVSSRGSEHALDGKKYPLEMHIVNFAEKYGNVSEAMKHPDGLAVLGVFFELSERDNPQLEPMMAALNKIIHYGDYSVVDNCSVKALLPSDLKSFYRYEGSLTTPPCYESVIWTVFAESQLVSERQLEALRNLEEHQHEHNGNDNNGDSNHKDNPKIKKIVDNFRPTQQLYKRKIKKSFPGRYRIFSWSSPFAMPSPGRQETPREHPSAVYPSSYPSVPPGERTSDSYGRSRLKGMLGNHDLLLLEMIEAQKKRVVVSEANFKSGGHPSQSLDSKGASRQTKQTISEQNTHMKLPFAGIIEPRNRFTTVTPAATTTSKPVFPYVTLISGEFLPSRMLGEIRSPAARPPTWSSAEAIMPPGSFAQTPSRRVGSENPYVVSGRRVITSGALARPPFFHQSSQGDDSQPHKNTEQSVYVKQTHPVSELQVVRPPPLIPTRTRPEGRPQPHPPRRPGYHTSHPSQQSRRPYPGTRIPPRPSWVSPPRTPVPNHRPQSQSTWKPHYTRSMNIIHSNGYNPNNYNQNRRESYDTYRRPYNYQQKPSTRQVYPQSAPAPVRVSKPYFYNFYMNKQQPSNS